MNHTCSFEGRGGDACVTTASSSLKPAAVTTGPSRERIYLLYLNPNKEKNCFSDHFQNNQKMVMTFEILHLSEADHHKSIWVMLKQQHTV